MYAKLFSSITESSLWSEPKEVRLLFVTMLAKADQTGFIEASVLGLARVANLSVEETENALVILENPDPYSKNPDNEGRRIIRVPGGFMLLNYEEYRSRRSNEERQEYMRKYMQEYRKQRKQDVNNSKPQLETVSHGKPRLAQAEAEAEAEAEEEAESQKKNTSSASSRRNSYSDSFEEFWKAFPKQRRTQKGDAYRKWKKITDVSHELLIGRASEYAASDQGRSEFAVMPGTWLSKRMWEDEPESWARSESNGKTQKIDLDDLLARR